MSAPPVALRLTPEEQRQFAAQLARWATDPGAFVREVFFAEPDAWQAETLRAVATDPRVAMSACKGPGKSCLLAWVIWWFLATRPDAQVMCTSITGPNLKDNLWKELAFWYGKNLFLQYYFDIGSERIFNRESPRTWWCSARSWAQDADATQQANTLAGFHGQHVLIVLDEVGDYPMGVLAAAEGIFANKDIDAHLVIAGNPTRTDGPLFHVTTTDRARWRVVYITGDPDDPKRSPRISLEWAREMIATLGRDHDWVRVNVLGQFPRVGSDRLLGPDDINAAEQRACLEADFTYEPIVYGLDVARFGEDRSVLYKRQGTVVFRPWVWRGLDGTQLGDQVAKILLEEPGGYDYLVVDAGGPGTSVIDRLRVLGHGEGLIPVDFGGAPLDERYADRGTEAWFKTAEAIRKYACLPAGDGELGAELTDRKYGYAMVAKRTKFKLESKRDLKARGKPSPDKADGLALTYAAPLGRRPRDAPAPLRAALGGFGIASSSGGGFRGGRAVTDDDVPVFRD